MRRDETGSNNHATKSVQTERRLGISDRGLCRKRKLPGWRAHRGWGIADMKAGGVPNSLVSARRAPPSSHVMCGYALGSRRHCCCHCWCCMSRAKRQQQPCNQVRLLSCCCIGPASAWTKFLTLAFLGLSGGGFNECNCDWVQCSGTVQHEWLRLMWERARQVSE